MQGKQKKSNKELKLVRGKPNVKKKTKKRSSKISKK